MQEREFQIETSNHQREKEEEGEIPSMATFRTKIKKWRASLKREMTKSYLIYFAWEIKFKIQNCLSYFLQTNSETEQTLRSSERSDQNNSFLLRRSDSIQITIIFQIEEQELESLRMNRWLQLCSVTPTQNGRLGAYLQWESSQVFPRATSTAACWTSAQ